MVPHVPIRTCAGCRKTDTKASLWRAVVDPAGRLILETAGCQLAGRGAYVHPEEKCLIAALARGGFERSFRRKLHLPQVAVLLPLLPGARAARQGAQAGRASYEDQDRHS